MESARSDQGSNVAEFGVAIGGRPGKGAQLRLTQRNIVEFGSDRLSRLAQAASVVAPSGHAAGSAFSPKAHRWAHGIVRIADLRRRSSRSPDATLCSLRGI